MRPSRRADHVTAYSLVCGRGRHGLACGPCAFGSRGRGAREQGKGYGTPGRRRRRSGGVGRAGGRGGWSSAQQVSPGQAAISGDLLQREQQLRDLQELQLDTRLRANTAIPAGQRFLFDYGGFVQFNYLALDDPEGEHHVLRESDFIPYARLNIDGVHEFFARGRIGWRDFNDGDSFDGRGDEPVDGDLDRGYYRFDLQRAQAAYGGGSPGDFKLVVQGGRDLVYWANGLVLGQVLDGFIVTAGNDRVTLEAVAGVTPIRTVDFDPSRPNFDHNTRRGFFGGMLSLDAGDHRPFVYGLSRRTTTTTTSRPSA